MTEPVAPLSMSDKLALEPLTWEALRFAEEFSDAHWRAETLFSEMLASDQATYNKMAKQHDAAVRASGDAHGRLMRSQARWVEAFARLRGVSKTVGSYMFVLSVVNPMDLIQSDGRQTG